MEHEKWGVEYEKDDRRYTLKLDKSAMEALAEDMANTPDEPSPQPTHAREGNAAGQQPSAKNQQQPETAEPAPQQTPAPDKAPQHADYWIEDARADLAAERARETSQERTDRDRQAADRSRENDAGRELRRW